MGPECLSQKQNLELFRNLPTDMVWQRLGREMVLSFKEMFLFFCLCVFGGVCIGMEVGSNPEMLRV